MFLLFLFKPMGNLIVFIVKFYLSIWFLFTFSIFVYVCLYNWLIPSYSIEEAIFFHHDVACKQHMMHTTLYNYHLQQLQQYSSSSSDNYHPLPSSSPPLMTDQQYSPINIMTKCQNVQYDIPNKNYRNFFHRGHIYYFELQLRMPDSQVNRNLGMFMIRLRLFDQHDNEIYDIYRPAILPYTSWLLSLAKMIAYIPLYLIGWLTETYTIKIKLLDQHADLEHLDFSRINRIRLEIETLKSIEIIPPSRLTISVHLEGIKYWMYFWPLSTSIVIIGILFAILLLLYLCKIIRKPRKSRNSNNNNDDNNTINNVDNNVDDRVSQFFNDSSIFDQPDSTSSSTNCNHHHHHNHRQHLLQPRSRHQSQ
ncbi:lipid droplet biogenesis associated protein seipin isoform X1 [Dermatophagoides pteronyssinus]|uniref:lipid droplet biogenesis associated protein seipin isoform X1 n=2 Tax=Dermatophagoides pteronyssinus TaxID=6956 RepID=UPI003F6747E1